MMIFMLQGINSLVIFVNSIIQTRKVALDLVNPFKPRVMLPAVTVIMVDVTLCRSITYKVVNSLKKRGHVIFVHNILNLVTVVYCYQ